MNQRTPARPYSGQPTSSEWGASLVRAIRSGLIRVTKPLTIKSSSTGIQISLNDYSPVRWGIAKTPAGGIPARNNVTGEISTVVCTLIEISGNFTTTTSNTIKISNVMPVAVGGNKNIFYMTHPRHEHPIAIQEVCG